MKKILILALLSSFASITQAADYKIDPTHTNARFAIDHFGTSTNVGGFYGLEGFVQFDAAKQQGSINLTIPIASLQTGSEHFTNHLKSADLFNSEQFPEMKFVSTQFHFQGKKVSEVDGILSLLGKTLPVTLKAEKFNCYQSPILKTEVCGGDFSTTIDRTKWGMNYLVPQGMSKNVRLDIQIEAGKIVSTQRK